MQNLLLNRMSVRPSTWLIPRSITVFIKYQKSERFSLNSIKKSKIVPVQAVKACRGRRDVAPLIDLGAVWR